MGRIITPTENDFGNPDAVVIGGGIVGTATAFWLSRAGLEVVLVEMRDGLSTLTTPASAECFRAQFAEPAMAELAKPSIEMFEHFDDVIGLQVLTDEGDALGKIVDVLETGANDVYVVEGDLLVPAIAEVVLEIDLAAGVMVIRPLADMLD